MTSTLTAYECLKALLIEAKKLDDVYSRELIKAIVYANEIGRYEKTAAIEDALQNLYEQIPQETSGGETSEDKPQTVDADWWPDELKTAMTTTKNLLGL